MNARLIMFFLAAAVTFVSLPVSVAQTQPAQPTYPAKP